MIVISRTAGEAILIGDDISVQVIAVDGDKVRLAIEHPDNITSGQEEVGQEQTMDVADQSP